jgi:hypothetical protein
MMRQRTRFRPAGGAEAVVRPSAYVSGDGKLRPELFDAEASEEARRWVESGIKTAQVRRFFGAATADRGRQ